MSFARAAAVLRGALPVALAAALTLCDHQQPFGQYHQTTNGPLVDTTPAPLTFDTLPDRDPSWTPDGMRMWYAFGPYRPDRDQCLAALPPFGGQQTQIICHVPPGSFDAESTDVLSNPAPGPDSTIAYLRESSLVGAVLPLSRELVVAPLAAPDPGRVVLRFPVTVADGQLYGTLSHLHWLGDSTLVFLAENVTYPTTVGALADTTLSPIEVARLVFSGDTGLVIPVPGTAGATSVTVSPAGKVYVTMQGSSVVTSVDPVSGAATQVFHFDSLPEVTEVQVGGIGGDRYVTVLGGEGSLTPGFRAGQMYTADIVAGTWHQSSTWPYWCYQRPAAEPSGRFLVAERHLLTFKRLFEGGPLDTIMSKNSDLWLVRVF